eukprot:356491-Chlamydomonas_euryale.AAC.3
MACEVWTQRHNRVGRPFKAERSINSPHSRRPKCRRHGALSTPGTLSTSGTPRPKPRLKGRLSIALPPPTHTHTRHTQAARHHPPSLHARGT